MPVPVLHSGRCNAVGFWFEVSHASLLMLHIAPLSLRCPVHYIGVKYGGSSAQRQLRAVSANLTDQSHILCCTFKEPLGKVIYALQLGLHGDISISGSHVEGESCRSTVWGQAVQYLDEMPAQKVILMS